MHVGRAVVRLRLQPAPRDRVAEAAERHMAVSLVLAGALHRGAAGVTERGARDERERGARGEHERPE